MLVDLVNELGWERLLEQRSAAFVMKGEAGGALSAEERAAAAAAAAAAAEVSDAPFGRKRRCHVWLDALFRALYCDLQVDLLWLD